MRKTKKARIARSKKQKLFTKTGFTLHCSDQDTLAIETLLSKATPQLLTYVEKLRVHPASAEAKLWWMWQSRKEVGVGFQVPMCGFIPDFYVPSAKLVVELDGVTHVGNEKYDERRTEVLETSGMQVVRFDNFTVFQYPAEVLELVITACADLGAELSVAGRRVQFPSRGCIEVGTLRAIEELNLLATKGEKYQKYMNRVLRKVEQSKDGGTEVKATAPPVVVATPAPPRARLIKAQK